MTTAAEQQLQDLDSIGELDRKNRIVRTVAQSTVSAAGTTVVEFVLAYTPIDLDPWKAGSQAHFPPAFTGALFVLLAAAAAIRMNRPPSAAPEDE